MRVEVSSKKVRAGDCAHFHAKLRPGMKQAFCEVFVSHGDSDPAPYVSVQQARAASSVAGSPMMMNTVAIRLSTGRPEGRFDLVSDENCRLHLMQELDVRGDKTIIGKVYTDGWLKKLLDKARRWFPRNA